MKIVSRLQATRLISRIKSKALNESEAAEMVDRLAKLGPDTIPVLLDALSHGLARPVALAVLERFLSRDTESLYLEALGSSNPAVLSGVEKLLSGSPRFDASVLLGLLSRRDINRAAVEHILNSQADRIPNARLLEALNQGGKEVQGVVLRILEHSCSEAAVPDLLSQMDSPHWHVRMHLLRILARFPGEKVIEAAVTCLVDENQEVRKEAIRSLERMKARDAACEIVPLLRDGNIKIQSAAIDAVSRLGNAGTVPALLDILKDESEYVRRAAVEVLNAIATSDAIQDLVRALRDEDWWVRVRAADALGTLGGDRVVEAVTELLDEKDEFLRRYAVEILITVPSERAVEPLIATLNDPDWWVRERCIDALGETRDPRGVVPLIDMIQESPELSALCAKALGRIGDPLALEVLQSLCDHDDPEVARNAKEAVATIHSREKHGSAVVTRPAPGRVAEGHPLPAKARPRDSAHAMGYTPDVSPRPAKPAAPETQLEMPATAVPAPGVPVAPMDFRNLPDGTVLLDRYTVEQRVGSGGFGVVYLVNDSAVQEDLILKILNPLVAHEGTGLDRFVRELKLSRRVTHENVIRIHDFIDLGATHAVSMEYFNSRDLGRIIDEDGSLNWKRSVHIAAQICSGLAAAHKEGVIHRDIKPPNILVGEGDQVKIVDFGLAAMEHQRGSRLTKSGLLVGTPEYIAPEQISDRRVDHRADLYAVGILLYEMISGEPPFTADTPVKILFKHMEGGAHPLEDLVPELPAAVYELVAKAMAREPEDRPADALEMEALCLSILQKEAA